MGDLAHYYRNREMIIERNSKYAKANPEANYKARKTYYQKRRDDAFEALGGALCNKCGFTDKRALQFDHINGGGSKHIRSFTTVNKYRQYIIDNPDLFQVLCANCNWIKVSENNERRKDGVYQQSKGSKGTL